MQEPTFQAFNISNLWGFRTEESGPCSGILGSRGARAGQCPPAQGNRLKRTKEVFRRSGFFDLNFDEINLSDEAGWAFPKPQTYAVRREASQNVSNYGVSQRFQQVVLSSDRGFQHRSEYAAVVDGQIQGVCGRRSLEVQPEG